MGEIREIGRIGKVVRHNITILAFYLAWLTYSIIIFLSTNLLNNHTKSQSTFATMHEPYVYVWLHNFDIVVVYHMVYYIRFRSNNRERRGGVLFVMCTPRQAPLPVAATYLPSRKTGLIWKQPPPPPYPFFVWGRGGGVQTV